MVNSIKWNKHYELEGRHSRLSPSNYAWQAYDPDKMKRVTRNTFAKEDGTKLHQLASDLINLNHLMSDSLRFFVDDAIEMGMSSEVLLKYSDNCFGTADAISYDRKAKELRIHDLKTGRGKVSFKQLYAYAALFCLEYKVDPLKIDTYLRIYQHDEYVEEFAAPDEIALLMQHIAEMDLAIDEVLTERYG